MQGQLNEAGVHARRLDTLHIWALNVNVNVGGPQQIFVQQKNNGVVNIGAPAVQPAPVAQEPTPVAQG